MPLATLDRVSLAFGHAPLLDEVSLRKLGTLTNFAVYVVDWQTQNW
jgi:hypothetical protein